MQEAVSAADAKSAGITEERRRVGNMQKAQQGTGKAG
jgi:hypothetical protein